MIRYLFIYLCLISLIGAVLTISDKHRAKKHKWRISEKALMLVGFFGGALSEYITMKSIHHKTKHKKFMIGLPLEIVMHILLITAIFLKTAQII